VNTVQHIFHTSAVPQSYYWLKTDRSLDVFIMPIQIFFASSCAKFHVQSSGCIVNFKQLQGHYLILDSHQIPLNSLLNFFFGSLTFVPIYCYAVVDIYSMLREYKVLWSGRNISQHQTRCMLLCIIPLLHAVHNQVDILIYCMHTVLIRSLCVLWLVLNWKCKKSNSCDVISFTRQSRNEIQNDGPSAWYLK